MTFNEDEKGNYLYGVASPKPRYQMKPYLCPVCKGTGSMPAHFYAENRGTSLAGEVTCQTCNGAGIIWG